MISLSKDQALIALLDTKGPLDRAAVMELIEAGADLSRRNASGRTPLMQAARRGDEELCRMMVEAGADIHAVDDHGSNAAEIADMNSGARPYLRDLCFRAETVWTVEGDDCVVMTRVNYASDFKMKAVFNFATEKKTVMTDCCSGGFASVSAPKSFSDLPAEEVIRAKSYLKRGL